MAAMAPDEVLQLYHAISVLMAQMARAAEARDWDRLRTIENQCRDITHRLMSEEAGTALSDQQKQRKFELLKQILADDAAIRAVTQPWMDELQQLIGRTGTQQKLNKAYRPGLH